MVETIQEYNMRRKIVEQILTTVDIEMQKLEHILNVNQSVQISDLKQMFNNIQNYAYETIVNP